MESAILERGRSFDVAVDGLNDGFRGGGREGMRPRRQDAPLTDNVAVNVRWANTARSPSDRPGLLMADVAVDGLLRKSEETGQWTWQWMAADGPTWRVDGLS